MIGILVLIFLIGIIIVVALSIETGWVFYVKNQAQAAVDAAALSGLAGIPDYTTSGSDTKVERLIEAFNGGADQRTTNAVARQNPDIHLSNVEFIRYENGGISTQTDHRRVNGLRITKTYTPSLLLGSVLRREGNQPITVHAVAALMGPKCSVPDLPFALIDCSSGQNQICLPAQCEVSFSVALANPSPTDNMAFFNIPDGHINAHTCSQLVKGEISADHLCESGLIELNNGTMISCLKDIDKECQKRGCAPDNPWKVTVPNVSCADLVQGNAVQPVPIRGFSRIGITAVDDHGSPKTVTFILLCNELSHETPGSAGPCGYYVPPVLVQ